MKRCAFCLEEFGRNASCAVCCGETAPSQDAAALPPGTWLVGAGDATSRYLLGRVLGSGGFGITYLGLHVQLGQLLAIKELFPRESVHRCADCTVVVRSASEAADFAHLRRRFVEEARTLAALPDDGRCVRALDIVEANGTAYMAMEYVRGDSLRAVRQREGGRLDVGLVHWLGVELAQALAHLHDHGLVHRDIAPDNAMLTPQHRVKLIDFGAARFVSEGGASKLSRVWKVGYAPPEQMADEGTARMAQGPWTDVYALGATLYELLSGQRPPDALARYVIGATSLRPALDATQALHPKAAPLCDLIESALQLDPAQRPQDGAAVVQRLAAPAPAPVVKPIPPSQRRLWAVAAALLAALLLGGGYWLGRGDDATTAAAVADAAAERGAAEMAAAEMAAAEKAATEKIAADRAAAERAAAERAAADKAAEVAAAEKAAAEKAAAEKWTQMTKGFVEVPAAGRSFEMSSRGEGSGWEPFSNEVPHKVSFRRSFWMQATEVTQGEWDAFVRSWNDSRAAGAPEAKNPSHFTACGSSCPVESVSWWDAVAYANWRSDEAGVQRCYNYKLRDCTGTPGEDFACTSYTFAGLDCRGYRLPTEAEWEYAARSGTEKGGYPPRLTVKGERNAPELADIAVYGGNSGVTYSGGWDCSDWSDKAERAERCGPASVKSKNSNALGLYDMIGNVWEWTQDCYQWNLGEDPKTDPGGEADCGGSRVVRGCSWNNDAGYCRAADRNHGFPTLRYLYLGFRLVVSAAPELDP